MKIFVVISDSHNRTFDDRIAEVRKKHPEADYYIHCGDMAIAPTRMQGWLAVKGNVECAMGLEYPESVVIKTEYHRIVVLHGSNLFTVEADPRALALYAKQQNADVVLFGHSHVYCDVDYNGIRLLNPGSIWKNKDDSPAGYMILTEEADGTLKAERRYWNLRI